MFWWNFLGWKDSDQDLFRVFVWSRIDFLGYVIGCGFLGGPLAL